MSMGAILKPAILGPAALKPDWVRPLVIGAALAVHAGAFALFAAPRPTPLLPPNTVEIAILPQAIPDAASEPEPEFPVSEVPPAPDVLSHEVLPPDLPPPPVAEAAPPIKPLEPKKPPQRKKPEQPKPQQAKAAPAQARTGARTGPADTGMTQSQYATAVVRAIQANKFYPASARNDGVTGSVGVHFTVGPSGRVRSAHIIRSSGSAALDGAALQIVRSISPPPPPGGAFTGSTSLRFNLSR